MPHSLKLEKAGSKTMQCIFKLWNVFRELIRQLINDNCLKTGSNIT